MTKKRLKKYELWYSESESSYLFSEAPIKKELMMPDARLLKTFSAETWDEACQMQCDFLGWGKYKPMEE